MKVDIAGGLGIESKDLIWFLRKLGLFSVPAKLDHFSGQIFWSFVGEMFDFLVSISTFKVFYSAVYFISSILQVSLNYF